jgi:phage terminase small subunit
MQPSFRGSDIRQAVAQFLVHPAYADAMSLTTMQELFVRALLSDPMRNATTAAIRAGYSEKRARTTARELLANPEVQLAIHEKETAAFQAADVDAAYVIMGIRDTVDRCRGMGKAFNPVSALKGFDLLGRYLKLWTDRLELNDVGDLAERIRAAWKEESRPAQQNTEPADHTQEVVASASPSWKPN